MREKHIFLESFRRAVFALVRYLLGRILWDMVPKRRGIQKSWLTFKDHLLQAEDWSVLMRRGIRRPAWMNVMLLMKPKCKKEEYKPWKQREGTQEGYKDTMFKHAGVELGKSKPTWSGI